MPGLILLLAIGVALGRCLWGWPARPAGRISAGPLAYGLMAFLFANAVMYAAAHQIYGDPLVLCMIGFVLGMAFAVPSMREGAPHRLRERRPRREASPGGLH